MAINVQLARPGATAAVAFGLVVLTARAELIVVYDSGQTVSVERYLAPLQAAMSPVPPREALEPHLGAADMDELLPIRSPGLTPGRVTPRRVEHAASLAFFLIGSDPVSLAWLRRHRRELIAVEAIGLLVDAVNVADLRAVAAAGEGLSITPGGGRDIADALKVRHYPFAITNGRLWQ